MDILLMYYLFLHGLGLGGRFSTAIGDVFEKLLPWEGGTSGMVGGMIAYLDILFSSA